MVLHNAVARKKSSFFLGGGGWVGGCNSFSPFFFEACATKQFCLFGEGAYVHIKIRIVHALKKKRKRKRWRTHLHPLIPNGKKGRGGKGVYMNHAHMHETARYVPPTTVHIHPTAACSASAVMPTTNDAIGPLNSAEFSVTLSA